MKASVAEGAPASLLERVVEHSHRTFCASRAAPAYLTRRGLTNPDLIKAFHLGDADGSLLQRIPRTGDLREELRALGVITAAAASCSAAASWCRFPIRAPARGRRCMGAGCGRRGIVICQGRGAAC